MAEGAASAGGEGARTSVSEGALPSFVVASSYTEKVGHCFSPSVPHDVGITIFKRRPSADGSNSFGELVLHAQVKVGPDPNCVPANPSYMCVNRAGDRLYVTSEVGGPDLPNDSPQHMVVAYKLDLSSGTLERICQQATGGAVACYVELSPDERLLAVANYMGGSMSVFTVDENGGLSPRAALCQHTGASGANSDRQEGPHAHMSTFDASGRHILVPDLGKDCVKSYAVSRVSEDQLEVSEVCPGAEMPAGSGPRHVVFDPSGRRAYVLNELLSTVATCDFDPTTGALVPRAAPPIAMLPDPSTKVGQGGVSFAAAIRMAPDGKFLYASNRGHDSITVFSVDPDDGSLSPLANQLTSAAATADSKQPAAWPPRDCPRDFTLCGESGRWLIAGNQDSDSLVVFARDICTGLLSPIGVSAACPAPVCIIPI